MSFEFKDAEIKKMKLLDMRPADYNPRVISDKASTGLGKSMAKFGMLIPLVWNKRSRNIVGGHQRYRKLIEAGEVETDVVVVDLDDIKEKALNIALNSKELRGEFTQDVVKQLEECEARMGEAFAEVGLADLFNFLKRVKQPVAEEPPEADPSGSGPPPRNPDAVLTCPRCRSRFKLHGGEVVCNMVKGGENA